MKNLLITDISGTTLSQEDIHLLSHPLVFGVILFGRNFESLEQLQALVASLQTQIAKPLLITVDQEGGRVQRFRQGLTELPAMQAFSLLENRQQQLNWAKEAGWQMASEMLALGIDLSFAPVLDRGFQCKAIGDRSFSEDPHTLIALGRAFCTGMHEAGMATTGKHFPGHGQVVADSHYETPEDSRPKAEIFSQDLAPFSELIKENRLDGIMPAHVIYPSCDNLPASASPYWLKDVLRGKLGFDGVIFSDDLGMKGADCLGDALKRANRAFLAGCDVLLFCNQRESVLKLIHHFALNESENEENLRQKRLARLKPFKRPSLIALRQLLRYQRNKGFLGELQGRWQALNKDKTR